MPALTKHLRAIRRMTADREAKRKQRLLEAQRPDTKPDVIPDADAEADEDPDVESLDYKEAATQFEKPNSELVLEILPEEPGTDIDLPMHTASNSVFNDILRSSKAQAKEGTFGIEQFPYQRGVKKKRNTAERASQRAKAKEELKGATAGCKPLTAGFLVRPSADVDRIEALKAEGAGNS